mmetsp:Transcript_69891/g.198066  ORF Transcript_69891/g.198066 Transcript_69891/m.198066 type:complete len:212 (+) Transcript_69891:205-840(+)
MIAKLSSCLLRGPGVRNEVLSAKRASSCHPQPAAEAVRVEAVAARRPGDRALRAEGLQADRARCGVAARRPVVNEAAGVERHRRQPLDKVFWRSRGTPRQPHEPAPDQAQHHGQEARRRNDEDDRQERIVSDYHLHRQDELAIAPPRVQEHPARNDRPDQGGQEGEPPEKSDASGFHRSVTREVVAQAVPNYVPLQALQDHDDGDEPQHEG